MMGVRTRMARWCRRGRVGRTGLAVAVTALLLLAGYVPVSLSQDDSETAASATPAERATDSNDPRDYLEFSTVLTADCMLHRAQLRRIANTHPTRAIRVVLWNYTGKTRSQGSSEKILPPASEPQALGCDGTSSLERRWEIERAEFVDVERSD